MRPLLIVIVSLCLMIYAAAGCHRQAGHAEDDSPAVVIQKDKLSELHDRLATRIKASSTAEMKEPGLIGAMGGVHVKLTRTGNQEVLLPLPQFVDAQVPLCYFIHSTPAEAVTEFRLQSREKTNQVVSVRLSGKRNQDVKIEWSAIVLIKGPKPDSNDSADEAYRLPSPCAQSESDQIIKLANELWPQNENIDEYAANIQRYISEMKQVKPPRSLDALGILQSKANFICTANANLAVALLRAKGIEARSLAVIPPTSQQLEMHRIVEYFAQKKWQYFDPSSLHRDIPMKSWQTVIMAKTTVADESTSMTARVSSTLGCPYGQEIELVTSGVTLTGQEFFWTLAKPLAQFQPSSGAVSRVEQVWERFLTAGSFDESMVKASTAQNAKEFDDLLIAN